MPRDLFGDVTRPSISIGNRKWYTVPVSLVSHAALVAVAVIVPLMASDVLPSPADTINAYTIVEFLPPPPPPPPAVLAHRELPPPDPNLAPTAAPTGIKPEAPVPDDPQPYSNNPGVIIGTVDNGPPPPPSVVMAPPKPQEPIRVGGTIRAPQKIRDLAPLYPQIAQMAGVQGTVIVEATIAADGHVMDARILRSVQLLDEAALTAVRQWAYTPTLLNGVPVPVIMTVTVTFTLKR